MTLRAGFAQASVSGVPLKIDRQSSAEMVLDVGVVIFDPGIPKDASTHSKLGIFPEIRKSEAKFMPVILRQVLLKSAAWGVVRVLPETLNSSELLVTGRILHSDGLRLALQIRVHDATGRLWLDKVYVDETSPGDYPVAAGDDPYQDLYHQIANEMLAMKQRLGSKELRNIRQVGLIRYAASLSPEVFAGYLSQTAGGTYILARLPAADDPMMERVSKIRNQEYLFIDTVDEQYAALYEEMAPTYNMWRQFGREQALYRESYEDRAANRERRGKRGTFAAMEQTYDAYKWSKIHEQDLDELALGFNNEVAPTVMEVSGKVFRLNGTLDTQYTEWRDILQQIFVLETGLTPDA
ncbi:MAG: hypothetical protein DRR04_02330 [Gammaproteobacteria bacterium]|nr:MAG: hypothetical protein DRQ97_03325 [Gammaproteobacteria bacterium]RLA61637.1 MAG: hypothetical protein DRR04_02330 [Gammaproteobacteria bacterium]